MRLFAALGVVMLLSIPGLVTAQDTPVISEFMAINTSRPPLSRGELLDVDGQSSDWIEMYNPAETTVNLEGWFLTDDADDLTKWEFPPVAIPAREFLLVFASGKDRSDPDGELHTNFRLSGGGEFLALVEPDGATIAHGFDEYPQQFAGIAYGRTGDAIISVTQTVLIPEQAEATVLIPADDALGTAWTGVDFDDSAWLSGTTGIGYDYADLVGLDVSAMRNVNPSVYVRISFDVPDASAADELVLQMKYEDGFAAYLNGQLVATANAPPAEQLAFDSLATANRLDLDAVESREFDLSDSRDALRTGGNVLAIHGLNVTLSSSDLLVLPRLVATETETAAAADVEQGYFIEPTPGGINSLVLAQLGPAVSDVTHSPRQPTTFEDLVITARVEPTREPVGAVWLSVRINHWMENIFTLGEMLPMTDDGTGPDAVAGDGVYSAVISSQFYQPGNMVRWFVLATDEQGRSTRAPLFLAPDDSPEYYGTVVKDPALSSDLPMLYWFTEEPAGANTRAGTRASVFFDGEFYDNVFVRRRGGYTAGDSQKFVFNKGFRFRFSDEHERVQEFNLNERGSDSSYLRQSLAFETMRNAGCPSSLSFLMLSVLNGDVDRVGIFIEQVDEEFLARNGFDPDGALYKFVQRSSIAPVFSDISTGIEKKTRKHEGLSDMAAVVAGLNAPTEEQRRNFVFDNFNLPEMMSYLAARCLLQDTDDIRKNFYFYRDTSGSGEWSIFPWDKDWTFGVVGDGWIYTTHPFLGADSHPKNNARQWSIYLSVMYHLPETQEMFLRRLRTVMDELLQRPGTPAGRLLFENRIDQMFASAQRHLPGSVAGAVNSLKNYFPPRRVQLYVDHSIHNTTNPPVGGNAGIPDSQPADAAVRFGSYDSNPASADQDQEYVELINPNDYAVDLSGWKLTGGVEHEFPPGTVIISGGSLYVTPDVRAFRQRAVSPTGGQGRFVQGSYRGHLSNWGETVELVNAAGTVVDVLTYPGDPSDQQKSLRITEIMYHPADPCLSEYGAEDLEYIELRNVGNQSVSLEGVKFAAGINFAFPAVELGPGAFAIVARDTTAFESWYTVPPQVPVFGPYTGQLSNGSERIKLDDETNSTILEFQYEDDWFRIADGMGFSLTVKHPVATEPDNLGRKSAWRPSANVGGSPGYDDTGEVPELGAVVINELLANSAGGEPDWIELHNTTNQALDLGGWFLSDDRDNLTKYQNAPGTVIPAGGYLVFDQDHHFGNADDPGCHERFALSRDGEAVYLHSGVWQPQAQLGDGLLLTGYSEQESFDASDAGVSLGRYLKSTGTYNFVALSAPTPGAANAAPQVGPVVITEIMYHPAEPADAEYVELLNISDAPVTLYDAIRDVPWRFTDDPDDPGIEFLFPTDPPVTLAPGEYLVIAKDADVLAANYTVPAHVQVFAWGAGSLSNGSEKIQLSQPGDEENDAARHWMRVDRVVYSDGSRSDDFPAGIDPWPSEPDGQGPSLSRLDPTAYGNDPVNWQASPPSPGSATP